MNWASRILKLEENWNRDKIDAPTHLAVSMTDYIKIKNEVAEEEGWDDEDSLLRPLYTYEGLILVISENPDFEAKLLCVGS